MMNLYKAMKSNNITYNQRRHETSINMGIKDVGDAILDFSVLAAGG